MKYFLTAIYLLFATFCLAQQDNMGFYTASYDGAEGATLLDMSLIEHAPVKTHPFLVITGVKFKNCRNGMGDTAEMEQLYAISDSVYSLFPAKPTAIAAGTFTLQCLRSDYLYITDTTGIRKKLNKLYRTRFPGYEAYINIMKDEKWDAYLQFLYPDDTTLEYMQNEQTLLHAASQGGDATAPQQIAHWLYFKTDADRMCFATYAKNKGFTTENLPHPDPKEPYELKIIRKEKPQPNAITTITLELKKQATRCHGHYDGWEAANGRQ